MVAQRPPFPDQNRAVNESDLLPAASKSISLYVRPYLMNFPPGFPIRLFFTPTTLLDETVDSRFAVGTCEADRLFSLPQPSYSVRE